jgi:hypothetical protein
MVCSCGCKNVDEMSVVEDVLEELFIDQEMLIRRPEYLLLISCFFLK